jgi:hypothetical protein
LSGPPADPSPPRPPLPRHPPRMRNHEGGKGSLGGARCAGRSALLTPRTETADPRVSTAQDARATRRAQEDQDPPRPRPNGTAALTERKAFRSRGDIPPSHNVGAPACAHRRHQPRRRSTLARGEHDTCGSSRSASRRGTD